MILSEVKSETSKHQSANEDQPGQYAVDGVKHYLRFFTDTELSVTDISLISTFEGWKIFGIAFSGDISQPTEHRITTFVLEHGNAIIDVEVGEILNEAEYLNLFDGIEVGELAQKLDSTSKELNESLRSLDSQKRPILLSALMICLFPDKEESSDFRNNYSRYDSGRTLITNLLDTVDKVLKSEGIPTSKREVLSNELAFCKTDQNLQNASVLKNLLKKLDANIIPLLQRESTYDILGRFYHDFLKYAGVTNVKNGIVLTPPHVCDLFTELIDFRTNEVILDPACGTGSFLIAGMRKLTNVISESNVADKRFRIEKLKESQLLGFEINSTMYSLSISNMLFKGDGKSNIYYMDFFPLRPTRSCVKLSLQLDL